MTWDKDIYAAVSFTYKHIYTDEELDVVLIRSPKPKDTQAFLYPDTVIIKTFKDEIKYITSPANKRKQKIIYKKVFRLTKKQYIECLVTNFDYKTLSKNIKNWDLNLLTIKEEEELLERLKKEENNEKI